MTARHLPLLLLVMIALLTGGCANQPVQPEPTIDTGPISQDAQVKLAEAAASVSFSLQELAEIEKASTPGIKIPPPPNPSSIGMAHLASVNWNGPVEPLIRKIAAVTHYQVRVLGKRPAIPALVSISAKNTPIADILRDAAFQVAKKVDLVLYPRSRVIELRYLGN